MKSIVFKTSLIIAVVLIVLMSAIGIYMNKFQNNIVDELQQYQKQYIIKQLNRTEELTIQKKIKFLKTLLLSISGGLSEALYNMNDDALKAIFKQLLLSVDTIKGIYVVDNVTNTIYLGAYKTNKKIVFSNKFPKNILNLSTISKLNLKYNNNQLGFVKIFFDDKQLLKEINFLKQKDLSHFEEYAKKIDKEIHHKIYEEIILFFILIIFIILIIALLLFVFVKKPLNVFQNGLNSFFKYLANSDIEVKKIEIYSNDEIGQMAKEVNKNIEVSMKLHNEIKTLMKIVENNVLIAEVDYNGSITNITKAFCKKIGYSKEELIGKNFDNFINNKEIINDIWQEIKNNKIYKGEINIIHKNQELFWIELVMSKQCLTNTKNCKYVAIGYDITNKKKVEELSKNLEIKVIQRTKDLFAAKKEIENIHKRTKDSIEFASLLQNALLPSKEVIDKYFSDEFIIWKPKDIVGGDIYLFDELRNKNECLLMVIDCTGHGVPGAFVTMIVKAVEREIVSKIIEDDTLEVSPAWILSYFNKTIKTLLKQDKNSKSNAGFDGGILYYNKDQNIIKYACANTPLFYVDDEVKIIKSNRYSVGYKQCDIKYEYKEDIIQVKEDMNFYITTDGYIDQNGGEKGFPFGKKRFKQLIEENYHKEMKTQKEIFMQQFYKYKKSEVQNDDITLIGLKI